MFQPLRSQLVTTRTALTLTLSTRRARAMAASSALARMPKGMLPLAIVFVLREAAESYALAGLIVGLVAVGDAVTTPLQGRLIDRLGPRRVLLPLAVLHVAAVGALLVAVHTTAPRPIVVLCGVGCGVGMPPVSGSAKAAWPRIVPRSALAAAYTVESLLQQLVFLLGPLLVAALAASPVVALTMSAAMVVLGTAWFVTVVPDVATSGRARHGVALRERTVLVLTVSSVLQGIAFGGLPVGIAAFASAAGRLDLAGVVQAALTVGGVLGTAMPIGRAGRRELARLTCALGAALAPVCLLAAGPGLGALLAAGPVLLAAGLLLTPVAATAYRLVEGRIPPARRTESFAWLSTGLATGNALGAAAVGLTADFAGASAALALLPVSMLAGGVIALLLAE